MFINHTTSVSNINDTARLKRLFFARLIGSLAVLILFAWLGSLSKQVAPILPYQVFLLWITLSTIQAAAFRFPHFIIGNLLFQLTSDLLIIGLLIFDSGGITSPIIFLLGVVIIIAGTQAHVLVVLTTAVLSSITYLFAINTYASVHNQPIPDENTLHILLQISLFFLAGGIMALIARRHASLQHDKQQTTSKHLQLQKLHRQILGSMQEGIIILNNDLVIHDFNQAAAETLNMTQQQIGKALHSTLKIPTEILNFIQKDDHSVFRTEIHFRSHYLLLTLTRLLEEDSTWLMTIVDITEARNLERKLAEQDKLASIGQMAAMLAHEIRNPMQTISQAVELMGLQSKQHNLEFIVTDEIKRLNRLVSDMLDYASPLHPRIQKTNINNIIKTSIAQIDLNNKFEIQVQAPDKNLDIDPDHFRLIIDNLLRNAIAASPDPQSVFVNLETHDQNWLLSVRDHGKGIDKNIRATLFEPFHTGRKQGTGLGLATVKQVCLANNWEIHVDENDTDGSCFIIENNNELMHGENHG